MLSSGLQHWRYVNIQNRSMTFSNWVHNWRKVEYHRDSEWRRVAQEKQNTVFETTKRINYSDFNILSFSLTKKGEEMVRVQTKQKKGEINYDPHLDWFNREGHDWCCYLYRKRDECSIKGENGNQVPWRGTSGCGNLICRLCQSPSSKEVNRSRMSGGGKRFEDDPFTGIWEQAWKNVQILYSRMLQHPGARSAVQHLIRGGVL